MKGEAEPSPSPPPSPPSPTTSALMARHPAMGSTHASREVETWSSISAINRFILSDLTRWSTFFGNSISTPLSPSAVMNSTSYPHTSVLGLLGWSLSLLGKKWLERRRRKSFWWVQILRRRRMKILANVLHQVRDIDLNYFCQDCHLPPLPIPHHCPFPTVRKNRF